MKFVDTLKEKNISTEDFILLVDLWIYSERDRKITKRKIVDDITYEKLAEEFDLSTQQIKSIVYKCKETLALHM